MKQFMFCVPTHPPSVPDATSISIQFELNKQKYHPKNWVVFLFVGGAGGNRTRVRKLSTGRSTYLDSII